MDPAKDNPPWEIWVFFLLFFGVALIVSESRYGEVSRGILAGFFLPSICLGVVRRTGLGKLAVLAAGVLVLALCAVSISAYLVAGLAAGTLLGVSLVRRDKRGPRVYGGDVKTLGSTEDKHKPLSGMPL